MVGIVGDVDGVRVWIHSYRVGVVADGHGCGDGMRQPVDQRDVLSAKLVT